MFEHVRSFEFGGAEPGTYTGESQGSLVLNKNHSVRLDMACIEVGINHSSTSPYSALRPDSKDRFVTIGRSIVAMLVCLAFASLSNAAMAVTKYRFIDLGVLPGTDVSGASAINAAGEVLGASGTSTSGRGVPFVWRNGTMSALSVPADPSSSASVVRISDSGDVAGSIIRPGYQGSRYPHAAIWRGESIVELGMLPGGTLYSSAQDLNDAGQVVGISDSSNGGRAFVWESGRMSELPATTTTSTSSGAMAVNRAGDIAGYSRGPDPYSGRAILWRNGVPTDLGDLPGGYDRSFATDLNDNGSVVGSSSARIENLRTDFKGTLGFIWREGVMTSLGDLPRGLEGSSALAVNNRDQVVGTSMTDCLGGGCGPDYNGTSHAFIWEDGVMWDLNDLLIGPQPTGIPGLVLVSANDINDDGWIVGIAATPFTYDPEAVTYARGFLLQPVPVPEPVTGVLMGTGLLVFGVTWSRWGGRKSSR
jgi:probable HAF family extracellular repeat protein